MKYLVLLAVAGLAVASPNLTGVSGGSGHFPGTDDLIDSYVYNSTVCATIPASFGDYRCVDDFQPTQGVQITKFVYWGVTTSTAPTTLNLMYFPNNAGMPSSTPGFETSYPVTTAASGFTFAGYTVWTTSMTVSITIPTGVYWYGFQRPGTTNWYVGIGPTVTGFEACRTQAAGYAWQPMSGSIQAADLFKQVEGNLLGLDRTTWGDIKTTF